MIIGITGNSGSGKTSIAKVLGTVPMRQNVAKGTYLDAEIIDADEIVKEMSVAGTIYYKEIVKAFGRDILLENGEIDKTKLAGVIFKNNEKRDALNSLTFKYIVDEIKIRASLSKSKVIIIDAPLLIESKLNKICDTVISIIASEDTKLKRICHRDNIDEKTALNRINAQPKDDFYINNSNLVIINNDNSSLEKQVRGIKEFLNSNLIKNKEIVIVQKEDLKIMQFKKLLEYKDIINAFTLKPVDVKNSNEYKANKEKVDNDFKLICELLKVDIKNVIRPYQSHTDNVKEVNEEMRNV